MATTYSFATAYRETVFTVGPVLPPPLDEATLKVFRRAKEEMEAAVFGEAAVYGGKTIDGECVGIVQRKALPSP